MLEANEADCAGIKVTQACLASLWMPVAIFLLQSLCTNERSLGTRQLLLVSGHVY